MAVRRKRVSPIWVVALIALLGGGGYYGWLQFGGGGKAEELPKGVQTGIAEVGGIDRRITASGVIAAQVGAKVNIGSQITGLISSLPTDVGGAVDKDQVVAVLDSPDLKARVEQQRHSVAVSRASLEEARSRLAQARLNATYSVEQTRAGIDEAQFSIKVASARLESAALSSRMQPVQSASSEARAQAVLSTSRSAENQVRQTVAQQLSQARNSIEESRVEVVNLQRTLKRQEQLYVKGYLALQSVDDTRTRYVQARARLRTSEDNLKIVEEKTAADLKNARDQILQSEAALDAARAERQLDALRAAEQKAAAESLAQAGASLEMRRANQSQDRIRRQEIIGAEATVRQAQASLRQAEAQLQYEEAQLAKTVIRSPLRGTVISITAQQGETVAAGLSAPTLITVADLRRLEVRAYIDETDIGQVRLGLPAEVRVQTHQDRIFHGRVIKVAGASTVKDNVVTYETTIELTDAGDLLRPDMTADVTLIMERKTGILQVPTEAVHREVGRALVYVLHREKRGKERVERREVRFGVSDGIQTEITSGLKEKEEVVLAGLKRLGVEATDSQSTDPKKNREE